MNKQREAIYGLRRRILEGRDLEEKLIEIMGTYAQSLVDSYTNPKIKPDEWDVDGIAADIAETIPAEPDVEELRSFKIQSDLLVAIKKIIDETYQKRRSEIGEHLDELLKFVMLRVFDDGWIDQLHSVDTLREGIGLRAWGQRDPLIEYKVEAFAMFQEMMKAGRREIISLIFKLQIVKSFEPIIQKPKNITYGAIDHDEAKPVPIVHAEKLGRNDPCPCGSGKKYKNCCMNKDT